VQAEKICCSRARSGSKRGAKFPETGWAPLEEIRAGKWNWLEPRPVRIFTARFLQVNSWQMPCYFPLKPGEFIQGLRTHIPPHHYCLYVVTVPLPAEHVAGRWQWPRIVALPRRIPG
jgi:hypothetical protein